MREAADVKADPETLRALAEARESVREGDVVYGVNAADDTRGAVIVLDIHPRATAYRPR